MNKTEQIKEAQGAKESKNTRKTSKVTLMKTFKSLGDRLKETELINEEELKKLGEIYGAAFERFINTF